jgi:hypothetical protein
VRAELRFVVPGQEALGVVAPERLVHDGSASVAEHVDRRDKDNPRDARPFGGLEDPGRRPDVGIVHRRLLSLRDSDAVAPGQVDHRVCAAEPVREPGDVGEIVGDELDAVAEVVRPRRVADEGNHRVAPAAKPPNDSSTHKPGCAGHDHAAHGRSIGPPGIRTWACPSRWPANQTRMKNQSAAGSNALDRRADAESKE